MENIKNKNLQKEKKRIIIITAIFIIFTLFLTSYLVIKDIKSSSEKKKLDLSTPEALLTNLQKALNSKSYVMLDQIFKEHQYTAVFGELFFDKDVRVSYGFSDDDTLNQQRVITSNDFKNIQKGRIKFLVENLGISILMIDEINPMPKPGENDVIRNLLNVAFLLQKFDDKWQITKLYDFMIVDSNFLEIGNFKLHYLTNEFYVELKHKKFEKVTETTLLYNLALSIKEIKIIYEDKTLCNFSQDNIKVYAQNREFKLQNDTLHNPDRLVIQGKCDYSSIISKDPEKKYLLYIVLSTGTKDYLIIYYGDLLL